VRKIPVIAVVVLFLAMIISSCQTKNEQEQSGTVRIISLAPHITEIIYALEAQDQLIAVTDFCKYPADAQKKEKIGGLINPNTEYMIALKPTHLFGMPSHEKLNQQLESFGYKITMMSNEKVSDVLESIRVIGNIIGRQKAAEELVIQINQLFDSLRVNKNYPDRIPAVLLIGRSKSSLQNMTVAGKDTYINEMWEMVGGENIYIDLPTKYGSINLESLLLRDPAVIIEFDMQKERSVEKADLGPEWQLLKDTRAVKKGQVYVVGGNHTMIPGPRMTLLAEDFRKIIGQVEKTSNKN